MKAERISDYFQTLEPNSVSARSSRNEEWASANQELIQSRLKTEGPSRWYSDIEVIKGSGIYTGSDHVTNMAATFYNSFGVTPEILQGKRVLDIGAFSGALSFYAEDCGAEVVAIDIQAPSSNGFALIHSIRQSTATHVTTSIYDLHPDLFGTFDIIVFSGVHYHLKHPLLALDRLSSVAKDGGLLLTVGTTGDYWLHHPNSAEDGLNIEEITRELSPDKIGVNHLNEIPLLGFYDTSYMGDDSNWFIPNTLALANMIKGAGFDVLSAETFGIPRGKNNVKTGCASIKGVKLREPTPEYANDVYPHLRRLTGDGSNSMVFTIPTWYELEKARRAAK